MGMRAYLLVDVTDDMEQQEFGNKVKELEQMPGVDFIDTIIGSHDMIIMVDAPVAVEVIARKIQDESWVKGMEILKTVSMFERHRVSKKELLKALKHGGV